HTGRSSVLHPRKVAGASPNEMTLGQPKLRRDVAYVNIQQSISLDVAEITTHPLEGILSQHARFRGMQIALTMERYKFQMAGLGTIVKQSVRAKIVREINLRQKIAVQIRSPHGHGPPARNLF